MILITSRKYLAAFIRDMIPEFKPQDRLEKSVQICCCVMPGEYPFHVHNFCIVRFGTFLPGICLKSIELDLAHLQETLVCATDAGGAKRTRKMADELQVDSMKTCHFPE